MSVFILLIWNKVVVSTKFCIFLIRNSLVVPSLVIYYTILEQFGCAWSSYIFSYSGTVWLCLVQLYILLFQNCLVGPGLVKYSPILKQFGCPGLFVYSTILEHLGCFLPTSVFSYSAERFGLSPVQFCNILLWNVQSVPVQSFINLFKSVLSSCARSSSVFWNV